VTIDAWLAQAIDDARRRELDALVPLLEGLAATRRSLADASWAPRADGRLDGAEPLPTPAPPLVTTRAAPVEAGVDAPHLDTLTSLARRLRRGETSAVELTERCLDAIRTGNGSLNAFITVTGDPALEAARRADAELAAGHDRGPLQGIPISLKDLFDLEGVATTAGSRVRAHARAARHAAVVARLADAGAVIVGKCNMHEFAFGTTNEDSGWGPARHPLDPSRSPGGSSGGSAAAVVAGMSVASIGSDTGGSVRIPSSICGLVGLKPTVGELPTSGVVPLSWTLDHVGPLARSVEDAWALTRAMRGRPIGMDDRLGTADPAALRMGTLAGYFTDPLDPEVRHAVGVAIDRLREAGTRVDQKHVPSAADIAPIYLGIVFAEAAAYHAATLVSAPEHYTPPVRLRLELARYLPAEDYARALLGRDRLTREVDDALEGCHALVLPTLPVAAFPLGADTVRAGSVELPVRAATLKLTQLFDITGHPAITLPCGTTRGGFPIGLQIVGRRGETDRLLEVARTVEAIVR